MNTSQISHSVIQRQVIQRPAVSFVEASLALRPLTADMGYVCPITEPTVANDHWAVTPKFGNFDHFQRWRCTT